MATCEWQLASDEWRRRDRHAADRQHQQHANDVTRRDTRAPTRCSALHCTAQLSSHTSASTAFHFSHSFLPPVRLASRPVSSRLVSSLSSPSRPPSRPVPSAPSHRHFASPARAQHVAACDAVRLGGHALDAAAHSARDARARRPANAAAAHTDCRGSSSSSRRTAVASALFVCVFSALEDRRRTGGGRRLLGDGGDE